MSSSTPATSSLKRGTGFWEKIDATAEYRNINGIPSPRIMKATRNPLLSIADSTISTARAETMRYATINNFRNSMAFP